MQQHAYAGLADSCHDPDLTVGHPYHVREPEKLPIPLGESFERTAYVDAHFTPHTRAPWRVALALGALARESLKPASLGCLPTDLVSE